MTTEISNAPLGDIGTKLLFEDDRVRIWEMALEPGDQTAPHRHDHDYYIIMVEGDGIAGVPHALSTGPSAEYIAVTDIKPGEVYPMKKGGIELARNVGTKFYREIIVELKKE